MVKNLPANAGDTGSIPGLGRPLEEGMATHSSIIAWEIQWTEKPGGIQSKGLQRVLTGLSMHGGLGVAGVEGSWSCCC